MPLSEQLAQECANWIAGQLTEEFGGFIAAEVIDGILELEQEIRDEDSDPQMDHQTMATRLLERLAADGIPVGGYGQMNEQLTVEILHWEDEFLGLAGQPRTTR